jgi:hypothetical protein
LTHIYYEGTISDFPSATIPSLLDPSTPIRALPLHFFRSGTFSGSTIRNISGRLSAPYAATVHPVMNNSLLIRDITNSRESQLMCLSLAGLGDIRRYDSHIDLRLGCEAVVSFTGGNETGREREASTSGVEEGMSRGVLLAVLLDKLERGMKLGEGALREFGGDVTGIADVLGTDLSFPVLDFERGAVFGGSAEGGGGGGRETGIGGTLVPVAYVRA